MDELQLEYKELSKKKEEIESQIAELNEVLSTVSYLHSDTDWDWDWDSQTQCQCECHTHSRDVVTLWQWLSYT